MPPPPADRRPFVSGLVLGAGGSERLGRPKQLLDYGEGTLLGHVVGVARDCRFEQTIVAIGGFADEVRESVDLSGAEVVVNEAYGAGCSSSIAAALSASFFQRLSSVSFENTTPQPKVSSGRLRSTTSTSCAGSRSFIEIAKYSPAGPAPMQTIFMQHLLAALG